MLPVAKAMVTKARAAPRKRVRRISLTDPLSRFIGYSRFSKIAINLPIQTTGCVNHRHAGSPMIQSIMIAASTIHIISCKL
ncbi:Uncharacterised protein [Mycobacterium tuberculosis]|nr:Uncharacterised protein [Mycobacterium tuberculosis]